MYGTVGSVTYVVTHTNTNSSVIKTTLDTWYQNNLINYSVYLADAGFCGDRSIASSANTWSSDDTALGYGTNITFYGAYNRLNYHKPQFKCPQSNDLYTTAAATKGNKALTYSIGLINADEAAYAGGDVLKGSDYYLSTGGTTWSMTPVNYATYPHVFVIMGRGINCNANVNSSRGLGTRPVINIKPDVKTISGYGTSSNPYTFS